MRKIKHGRRHMLYAVYKGDKFIDVGTADELAERLGYFSAKHIAWYSTPSAKARKKRTQQNREYMEIIRGCYEYEDGTMKDIEEK